MNTTQTTATTKRIGISRVRVYSYNKPLKQCGDLLFECDNYDDVEERLYWLSINSIGRVSVSEAFVHITTEGGEPMIPLRFVFVFKNGREQSFTSTMNTHGVFHDDRTFGEIVNSWIVRSSKLNPGDSSFTNLQKVDALDLLAHYQLPSAFLGG